MSFSEPLWEVFIRSKQGLDHKHVGSLHAADAAMAISFAGSILINLLVIAAFVLVCVQSCGSGSQTPTVAAESQAR